MTKASDSWTACFKFSFGSAHSNFFRICEPGNAPPYFCYIIFIFYWRPRSFTTSWHSATNKSMGFCFIDGAPFIWSRALTPSLTIFFEELIGFQIQHALLHLLKCTLYYIKVLAIHPTRKVMGILARIFVSSVIFLLRTMQSKRGNIYVWQSTLLWCFDLCFLSVNVVNNRKC